MISVRGGLSSLFERPSIRCDARPRDPLAHSGTLKGHRERDAGMATNPVASAAIAAKRRGEFCPPRPDVISLAPGAEPPIARLEKA